MAHTTFWMHGAGDGMHLHQYQVGCFFSQSGLKTTFGTPHNVARVHKDANKISPWQLVLREDEANFIEEILTGDFDKFHRLQMMDDNCIELFRWLSEKASSKFREKGVRRRIAIMSSCTNLASLFPSFASLFSKHFPGAHAPGPTYSIASAFALALWTQNLFRIFNPQQISCL
jgi:hypothetical protein